MNFSRKGTAQKEKDIKSTAKRLSTKTGVSIFRIVIVTFAALVIIGCIAAYGAVKAIIDKAPDIADVGLTPTNYKTTIYDSEGTEIDTLSGKESNRIYVEIEDIPKVVQDAFVAIEDERFYEHNGIDVRGIFRAFFVGLKKGNFSEGASTITQQLIKNQVFDGGNEQDFLSKVERKIQEQYLAVKLESLGEKEYMKKEILERYLNTINCGATTYGVQTASKRYFNKDVKDLTLSEAAVIAVITNSPVNYNPIKYPEDNKDRRQRCLDKMLEQGYCTQAEYDEAIADTDAVYERVQAVDAEYQDTTSFNSYFVDALIDQVLKDLVEKGYTQSEATNMLYSGGLNIYTTQDSQIQKIVDEAYQDESLFPTIGKDAYYELTYALSILHEDDTETHYHTSDVQEFYKNDRSFNVYFDDKAAMQQKIDDFKASVFHPEKGDKISGEKVSMVIQPQSSFVVMDQKTGYVAALIGGRGNKDGDRTLNRATDTKAARQPGSTFKILSAYLPALDTAGLTLATTFDDAQYFYPGTNKEVKNYDTKRYKGLTTIREAIEQSMNIVAVKTLEVVTPQVGYDYLLKLGFTTLADNNDESGTDISYPLALGGLTHGVTNLQLTAAYAAIANSGTYNEPTLYTKITDHKGRVLIDKTKLHSEQVMKESTAWLLTNAMQDVVTKGTGRLCRFQSINMPVAGKTGTTSSYNDLWFSGYTPYYTASVWSGFDYQRSQTAKNYHKILWRTIMERIHKEKGLKTKDFKMPDSIVTETICTKSGKIAVNGLCNHAVGGSTVKTEYFAKGTAPTEICDLHKSVKICKTSGNLATEYCPEDDVEELVYLDKEETSPTDDTKYLLPTKECNVHDEHSLPTEGTPDDTELPEVIEPTDTPLPPTVTPEPSTPKPTETPEPTVPPVNDPEPEEPEEEIPGPEKPNFDDSEDTNE